MNRQPNATRLAAATGPLSSARTRRAAGRSSPLPRTIGPPGPDVDHPLTAAGDRRGNVDVGADFFSASELAQLQLDGLPDRREHIARRATREQWPHRERQGKGGGREFPLSALPPKARGDLLRRRMERSHLVTIGQPAGAVAPLPALATLRSRQAERLAARSTLLSAFDAMRNQRSARAAMPAFLRAYADGHVELPDWTKPLLPARLSEKTLKRWRAAKNGGREEALAGRWPGVKGVFDRSDELTAFVVGAHVRQPKFSAAALQRLVEQRFPEGVPDANDIMMPRPSLGTIARFLARWKADPTNALVLSAVNDPDGYRGKYRFAVGDAGAGIVRPNQRWQIDASPADVLCIDGYRYTIYVVVDVFSRRLLALVSRTPRTVASLLLIARACQQWGVPEELWTDNGADFTSKHFLLAVRQLGVHHHLTPPYSPERKPFVERAIGTIQNHFMPHLQGYVGNSVAMRTEIAARTAFAHRLGESESRLMEVSLDAAELQDLLSAWLANEYERRPHGGLGRRAPIDVWHEGVAAHPQRFAHPQAIGALLMPPAQGGVRVVGRKGVSVEGIDYINPTLTVGQRVQVRLDPDDLGAVWLYTDTDPWTFLGVAENIELRGLDRAEMAAKARALQDAVMKEGRATLRRLAKQSNVYELAARMIGDRPALPPANSDVTHTTPALEEAARAVTTRGRRALPVVTEDEREAHRDFVATFDEPEQPEETGRERYDRWLSLKAMADRGEPIPDELLHWFHDYPTQGEWRGQRLARGHDDGDSL